jgi:hypothetical protein
MQNPRSIRCLSTVLVLALLLAAPWFAAAQPSEALRFEPKAGPIHLFLDWLEGLWGDNGCTFDPSGGCRDGAASESPSGTDGLDNGCTFDPDGSPCHDNR